MVAIGGLVVAVLFAALLAPFVLDWSNFRVEFEQQASRVLGKKVSVHGEVDARLLPFPSVTLHDVRVGQDIDGQPQARITRFSMDMELAPFLSGEARIFDMRVEDPVARVRILKDGTLDWMRGSRPAIPTRIVVIEDVHISGGQVTVVDERSGRTRNLTGIAAEMAAASLTGPWRGEGNATLDGEEARFSLVTGSPTGSGSVPLRLRLWPDSEPLEINLEGELAIAENVPTYSGSFAASVLQEEDESEPVVSPPPGPRVKGSFDLTNDRIRIADYRLEVGSLDDPYVVTGEATLDTGSRAEFLLTAEGQQIDVNRLGLGARGKTGRDAAASAQRRLQAFVEMAASIPIPQVPGRASLKLPAVVLNDTTIRDIQLDVRPAERGWTVDKAVATLPGRTRMEADGALVLRDQPSFIGDVLFASTQPSGLAEWLSGHVDPAIRQLRSAGFSAKVDLASGNQQFRDLELAISAATLRGSIERRSVDGQRPELSVDLAGDEIDLDAMRALASLVTGEDAGRDVLDHRLQAKLAAQRFTASGVAADDLDASFTISDGVLSIGHLSVGNVAGATISAEGRVEGSLLSYSGNADLHFRAADASGFFDMLRRQLPPHPVLDRLASNASYFADADMSAELSFGESGGGVKADLKGRLNGTAVNAKIDLPTAFDLTSGNAMSLTASLENPQSEILLGQAGLEILPFGGDGPGSLSIDIGQTDEGPAGIDLLFKTEHTQFSAKGEMSLLADTFADGRAHVSVKSRDIEPYLLLTGMSIPQFGGGLPLDAEADVAVSRASIDISGLRMNADGNEIKGTLSTDRTAAGTKIQGAIEAGDVDLAWLGEAVFGPLFDPASGEPSREAFSRPLLADADISLDLRARSFEAAKMGLISDLGAKVRYQGSGISLDDVSGEWRGGKIGGRLLMSNGNGTGILQTRLRIEGADLAELAWKTEGQPVATGRMAFDASAEASGGNLHEVLTALSGSGNAQLSDLVIKGVNPQVLNGLKTAADEGREEFAEERVADFVREKVHEGQLELARLEIPFTITAGQLRVQELRATSNGLTISAEGSSNLSMGQVNAAVSVTYDPGQEAIAGGDPTLTLNYSGDLMAPQERIDTSKMANYISMRAYEQERRRVEILQSSVLEKQRLRREVALYSFNATRRAAERARLEEEERGRQAIIEAARAAEEERRRQPQSLQLQVPPTDENLVPDQNFPSFDTPPVPGMAP